MRYEAMDRLKSYHSIRKMAQVLGVKDSAFYQWRRRRDKNAEKQREQEMLVFHVRRVFEASQQTYGYRKMTSALSEEGVVLSEYRVRGIMRANGMYPVTTIKYRPARSGKVTGCYLDNLFNQDFSTTRLNEKWAGDITYIKTKIGWVYLACVIDLHNREIVGYDIARKADTELVCRAFSYALFRRTIAESNTLTFHCDRGVQYASKRFQNMLTINGVTGSMSRPGCPYDNAVAENFFSTAKRERIYRKDYTDITEVRRDLFDYIEVFYNRKRIQTCLGNVSPVNYRLNIETEEAA
jgi:transposase InsO family protein